MKNDVLDILDLDFVNMKSLTMLMLILLVCLVVPERTEVDEILLKNIDVPFGIWLYKYVRLYVCSLAYFSYSILLMFVFLI